MSNSLLDLLQGASNAAAGTVSAPVDGLAWLLRKAGVAVPAAPVGGSDWMAQRGLTAQPRNALAGLAGETLGNVLPMAAAAKAPQVANALLKMGENAAAPATLGKQRGIFGGEWARGADLQAREQAIEMLDQGFANRDVHRATGWFQGPDGKMRFEIDDSGARLPRWMAENSIDGVPVSHQGALETNVEHSALFDAYPHLRQMRGETVLDGRLPWERPDAGSFDGGTVKVQAGTSGGGASVALHELQHAVQRREGFARGGSLDAGGMDAYRRLAGEAEARAVQARMHMTPDERRASFPLDSYDVPLNQLIFR